MTFILSTLYIRRFAFGLIVTKYESLNSMSNESFAELFGETAGNSLTGTVIAGTIIDIQNDNAIIDVGLKSEGRVPVKEFALPGEDPAIKIGDVVDVFVERYEDRDGLIGLSRERARREEAWVELEKKFEAEERVEGVIFNRVKGGFTVDLGGAVAFLPGSQVDIRPVRDVAPLMNVKQPFALLKMDRLRGNIVVSRRAILEETRNEARAEIVAGLEEGKQFTGIVKNITDYGAFVDLGGVDGLLHVTDISWKRINHPSEALTIGQQVDVIVIKFNEETQRISLGMKQLEADPWDAQSKAFTIGQRLQGQITNITDYGAFVELQDGIEGLVHVSEMSWTKKNVHPGKIVSTSQEVEVMILDIDNEKRRISLGLKQCQENPWIALERDHPVGSIVEGEVKNATEFGLFIGLNHDIDGMVHLNDISWDKSGVDAIQDYKKGDVVQAKVLEIDPEKERIGLGIKQMSGDPFADAIRGLTKGQVTTVMVKEIQSGGLAVEVVNGVEGYIRRGDLSRDRGEQRTDRFAVGERIDAKITTLDAKSRRINLSIRALEEAEEREAIEKHGSSDSGAALGSIFGEAFKKAGMTKEQS